MTLYQSLYKHTKRKISLRGNGGERKFWKPVFPSASFGTKQIERYSCFRAQGMASVGSVGVVLVFSLRDGETNGSDKVCDSGVPLFSTKLFSLT